MIPTPTAPGRATRSFRLRWFPALVCCALAGLWGLRALAPADPPPAGAVFRIGERTILEQELASRGALPFHYDLRDLDRVEAGGRLLAPIEEELLYQEALRRGFQHTDTVVRRALAQCVLDEAVMAPAAFRLSEDQVRAHYTAHPQRFRGPEGPLPFEVCAARVRADLVRRTCAELYEELLGELWARNEVVVFDPGEAARLREQGLALHVP